MRTEDQHDDALLDRATAALRRAPCSREVPPTLIDATLARLRSHVSSPEARDQSLRPRPFFAPRLVRTSIAITLAAAFLLWLTLWPSPTSALAQAAKNVQSAKSVIFDLRAKSRDQPEQVDRVKILGDVIRQERAQSTSLSLVNHRTGEMLTFNTAQPGSARRSRLPVRNMPTGDPIAQLLGLLKVANEHLGNESLKGVTCAVFRGHDTAPLGIPGPGEFKIWIDAKTRLPIRVEARGPNRQRDPGTDVIFENFTWNAELDPAQCDMDKIEREYGSSVETAHGHRLEVFRVKPPSLAGSSAGSPAESRDQSGLRLIGLAIHRYLDRHEQRLVPAIVIGPDGKTPHSWRVEILPFLGKGGEALYREYRLDEPWDSPANKRVLAQMPDVFRSADDDLRSTNSSFFAVVGPGTVFEGKDGIKIDRIPDGTSTTILLVEAKRSIPWTKPEDIPYDPAKPLPPLGGFDGDRFLALFANCSTVRQFSRQLGERTLKALIGRNDGTVIDVDSLSR